MRSRKLAPQVDISQVWRDYKATGRRDLRNVLMETYLPIVKYSAERIGAKLPDEVEVELYSTRFQATLHEAFPEPDLPARTFENSEAALRVSGTVGK